ncbi:zinc finger protein 658B-like isoform X2 [Galleria mellonella]|uniref:Zinc finger protein 658B-like isoform X2 n=1 Tax=Galleria mellonella TaxID=7137 RepID=A0ABM3MBM2_GALME|nr:zinc finger protein 658B-like isoform X2 [Galleria mellonella]
MTDFDICRICLNTQAKCYKFDQFRLKDYYEEILGFKANPLDNLPHTFCYECATMLYKYHKFKEKCYLGLNLLTELLREGPITHDSVLKIKGGCKHLQSPLQIVTVCAKHVRTYFVKDNNCTTTKNQIENVNENVATAEKMSDDCVRNDPEFDPVANDIDSPDSYRLEIDETSVPELDEIKENKQIDIIVENLNVAPSYSPNALFIDDKEEIICNDTFIDIIDHEEVISKTSHKKKKKGRKKKEIEVKRQTRRETRNSSKNKITMSKKENSFKATNKKMNILEGKNWKKITLSEEEAQKEFNARSEDRKYIAAAFKCTDCYKGFSKDEMLNRHRQLRHNKSIRFECRFCHMHFSMDCYLRKHMRQHYTKYECQRCQRICPLETTALLHEEFHTGDVKKCEHCNKEFRHLSTYYTHLRTHRSEHVCTLCGVSFVSMAGLHMHKKVKHVNNEIERSEDETNQEEVDTYCERCDIRFETRRAYDEHLSHSVLHVDNAEESDVNQEVTDATHKTKYRKPMRAKTKPTTCRQCGKHFETQAACLKHHLAEHPRTAFTTDRYVCEICGVSLAPGSIAAHQNRHTRRKLYPCDICGRTFNVSVVLKRHMLVSAYWREAYIVQLVRQTLHENPEYEAALSHLPSETALSEAK